MNAGGVSQPDSVIEQLTYLMFARQLDEAEAEIESAELHRHFTEKVFPFMKHLNPDVESAFSRYLSGASFKLNDPLALKKVVQGLDELFQNDIRGLDMQGDLYEHMLGKLNSAGRLGAFRTPKHIRDMMVSLMTPVPDMRICENCTTSLIRVAAA